MESGVFYGLLSRGVRGSCLCSIRFAKIFTFIVNSVKQMLKYILT
ncbi:hypothetical protein Cflav_PD2033 [Pedosphaera parvula Ellin514]|uniref:Uncharacterized protein n=1 Tax=Pedosphaera parvula (strain Ellin514) TaxID=320771 RepID=B9XME2_PEDPL|nr:hypothetical protein Cflav_PD2033 [Pedosphaera parvula Ellin514]